MIYVHFQDKSFNITVIQVYVPTSNTEKPEVEWVHDNLQDLLELTPKKTKKEKNKQKTTTTTKNKHQDVLFIVGAWNAKLVSQEIPGVTGKFDLVVQNEAGQRLKEFCRENTLVIANTLFQQYKN